jgi:hypothetical protein
LLDFVLTAVVGGTPTEALETNIDMHHTLYEKLRVNTFLLQFYGYLTRGFFSTETRQAIDELIGENVERLQLMKDPMKWEGKYDLVTIQLFATEKYVTEAKGYLKHKQVCNDIDIANYMIKHHHQFYEKGILLNDLKKLLDIEVLFKNGYMLHDIFNGYPEKNMFRFQIDCMDYLHSAAYFYNEAYDYYNNRKEVKFYDAKDFGKLHPFEMRRIQPKEEVMFRNFREAYINMIFFIESFINSVGYNAYLDGVGKTEKDEFNLRGIQSMKANKKPIFSDLTQRIKNFAKIIGNNSIDAGTEPYQSYLNQSVELRNQYIHSSPEKGKIQFSVEDWKKKCDEMISTKCFDFLNAFWKSCYPNLTFPKVIFNEFHGSSFKGHQGKFVLEEQK